MHRSTSKRSSKKSTGKSSSSRRRSRRAPSSSSSELSSSTSDSGSEDEEYEVGRKSRGRRSLRTMLDPGKTTTYAPVPGNVAPSGSASASDSDTATKKASVSPPAAAGGDPNRGSGGCNRWWWVVIIIIILIIGGVAGYVLWSQQNKAGSGSGSSNATSSSTLPASDVLPTGAGLPTSASDSLPTLSDGTDLTSPTSVGNLSSNATDPFGTVSPTDGLDPGSLSSSSTGALDSNTGNLSSPGLGGDGAPTSTGGTASANATLPLAATTPAITGVAVTQPGDQQPAGPTVTASANTTATATAGAAGITPTVVVDSPTYVDSKQMFTGAVKGFGNATYMFATDKAGSCNTQPTDDDFVVHVSKGMWWDAGAGTPLCGRHAVVWNPANNKTKMGTVQDYCKLCTGLNIDISKAMFEIVGGDLAVGVVSVYWWNPDTVVDTTTIPKVAVASSSAAATT